MNADDYSERQYQRDAEYLEACDAWIANASSREIEKMKELGLAHTNPKTGQLVLADVAGKPSNDVCCDGDAAQLFENSLRSAEWSDVSVAVDKLPDLLAEQFGLSPEKARALADWHANRVNAEVSRETALQLNRVIGFYLQPGNIKVRTHALAHAARMAALSGLRSLRHSAQLCEVSVEAIRKVAWRWVELLELPPLEGSKSAEACKRYSEDKMTNHWRKQKVCTTEQLH